MDQGFNKRVKAVKLLEENIEVNHYDLKLVNGFLERTTKAQ